VIRTDQQRLSGGRAELAIVPEHKRRAAADHSASLQHFQVRIESDFAQRDNHAHFRQQIEFALEKRPAIAKLFGRRLISRRRAARRGGDINILQLQPVIARNGRRLRRKSGPVEGAIKDLTRAVAGKHAPGAIRAMSARRQAEHEHARSWIAERRHGLTPVALFAVSTSLHLRDRSAMAA
jgi:hypothetical protein